MKVREAQAHTRPADPHLGDLWERALAQTASSAELSQLHAHGRACAACAALLKLGPTLVASVTVDADRERDRRVVARALSAPRSSRRRGLVLAFSAAAVLFGSLAAARYLGGQFGPRLSEARRAPPRPVALAGSVAPAPSAPVAQQGPAAASPASGANPDVTTLPPAASGVLPVAETAAGLFVRSNQLRRLGHDTQAIEGYRRLQRLFPRSSEAALSCVTLGALLLQHGDARHALTEFDRYSATGGPVLEEALAGRARALGQLGDCPGERAAWQTLLVQFPSSLHAARARARMTELK